MYRITGYLDLAPDRPSPLILIFARGQVNIPYAKSMDEFYQIDEFFPYFDCEEFDFITE